MKCHRNYLLKIHKNGFEKLESKIDILPEKYEELFEKLNTIYLEEVPIIEMRNQLMRNYASSTKENYVKNYWGEKNAQPYRSWG